jgi:PEP phosphonomutase and related enzymes
MPKRLRPPGGQGGRERGGDGREDNRRPDGEEEGAGDCQDRCQGGFGLDEAIERGNLYGRAGADLIFPEALLSREEFAEAARRIGYPLLANMTEFGKSPYISAREFREMGYRVVIFPVTAFRAAARAAMDAYAHLMEKGTQGDFLDRLMSRKEQYEVIRYHDYEELDGKIAREAARRSTL